jgi:hypothetical protein
VSEPIDTWDGFGADTAHKREFIMSYREGTKVEWNWGNGTGTGKIVKKYTRKITLEISGTEVTRDASEDEPAYKIEQDDGSEVLKSGSELSKAS